MKHLQYDHMGYLKWPRICTLTLPNLTLIFNQLKQILINQPQINVLAWNFQNMTTWVTWYHLGDLPSFVLTYQDHGHPITNTDTNTKARQGKF